MSIIKTGLRLAAPVVAAALLFAAAPTRTALANDFTDSCVAGGGGMFEAKDCACLDGKVTIAGDRQDLIAYFKLNAAAMKGSAPTSDAASAQMQKGTELVGKYIGECTK
jgi:hypothetical protein